MFEVTATGITAYIGDRFVSAGAVADEIVRRLMPNELSATAAEYVRKTARHSQVYWKTMLFGGYDAMGFEAVANPDGSLRLTLQDCNGCTLWRTTLLPAA